MQKRVFTDNRMKKGISAVVTTVLLILISIIAVVLIAGFIIPMIKNNLANTSCFDLRDAVKISDSEYSCSNETLTSLMIERSMENMTIMGIQLNILAGANSRTYTIKNGISTTVKMYNMTGITDNLEVPGIGESRTYLFDIPRGDRVRLGVISSNNKACEMESFTILSCE